MQQVLQRIRRSLFSRNRRVSRPVERAADRSASLMLEGLEERRMMSAGPPATVTAVSDVNCSTVHVRITCQQDSNGDYPNQVYVDAAVAGTSSTAGAQWIFNPGPSAEVDIPGCPAGREYSYEAWAGYPHGDPADTTVAKAHTNMSLSNPNAPSLTLNSAGDTLTLATSDGEQGDHNLVTDLFEGSSGLTGTPDWGDYLVQGTGPLQDSHDIMISRPGPYTAKVNTAVYNGGDPDTMTGTPQFLTVNVGVPAMNSVTPFGTTYNSTTGHEECDVAWSGPVPFSEYFELWRHSSAGDVMVATTDSPNTYAARDTDVVGHSVQYYVIAKAQNKAGGWVKSSASPLSDPVVVSHVYTIVTADGQTSKSIAPTDGHYTYRMNVLQDGHAAWGDPDASVTFNFTWNSYVNAEADVTAFNVHDPWNVTVGGSNPTVTFAWRNKKMSGGQGADWINAGPYDAQFDWTDNYNDSGSVFFYSN
jgi:hypothetical protein